MVGDIQANSEGAIRKAAMPVNTPKAMCQRCRRTMSGNGIEPSSRRCGFQPVSRPAMIWNTEPDWISIMIGAISADMMTSSRAETVSRRPPPQARLSAVLNSVRSQPNSLGASRIAMVNPNNESARSGSNRGQTGTNVNSCVKYSGRAYFTCSTSAMPTSNCISQKGEAR